MQTGRRQGDDDADLLSSEGYATVAAHNLALLRWPPQAHHFQGWHRTPACAAAGMRLSYAPFDRGASECAFVEPSWQLFAPGRFVAGHFAGLKTRKSGRRE
jgi:hypothetical protein